jgi:hypothetical protein
MLPFASREGTLVWGGGEEASGRIRAAHVAGRTEIT